MESDVAATPCERTQLPVVAQRAGRFVAEFEAATPESPVSLNTLAEGGDLVRELQGWLEATNELYKHNL